jgi:hypothetical protein
MASDGQCGPLDPGEDGRTWQDYIWRVCSQLTSRYS